MTWGKSAAIIHSVIAAALLVGTVCAWSAGPVPYDVRGWWDSRFAWIRIEGEVTRQESNHAWGVVNVHYLLGGTDTYHCEGVIEGDTVEAWHHSGHHFSGRFKDPDTVAGTLTHRDGQSYEIVIHRRKADQK